MDFKLQSDYSPKGDQPEAIRQLVEGLKAGEKEQVLLGVTGSGKTFTMANVIEQIKLPTLIISHNKTLAAQLYEEFKEFFPDNAVEYFVSFYDYYQPEAYIPSSDTYIEKTADINDEIDRLRLKATSRLLSRKDVIIVASVSCIYNIGSPDSYGESSITLNVGEEINRRELFSQLVTMQYERTDLNFDRGSFRVRGDVLEIYPAYEETALRIETFGDEIEKISQINSLSGKTISSMDNITIFPAKHFVNTKVGIDEATEQIRKEMEEQLKLFDKQGKIVEAHRLKQRTEFDIEMLKEIGYVNGIENYSRIFDGRPPGSRPFSLIDFFKGPFLTIIDESHATIPQIGGMYNGDRARKTTLVDHGFRIPSALDNRPLKFDEFEQITDRTIYLSATPADYELKQTQGVVVEQVIRPTGLVDPPIVVKPAKTQVDDLIEELRSVVEEGERALVTTLTKKMANDLTEYLETLDFKVRYLHSEINTLERPEIIRSLREGEFDILIGINLLREGLDIPEVALVAILDADREGFLRSTRSLIQIAGRAARNINGRIILYADKETKSIKQTLKECGRRREKQLAYNEKHGIIPKSTNRKIGEKISPYHDEIVNEDMTYLEAAEKSAAYAPLSDEEKAELIRELEKDMAKAASELNFEKAAKLRDRIMEIKGETFES